MSRDTVAKTFSVAGLLCLVCSLLVSAAAVLLKPLQEENKALDLQKNILVAAGLYEDGIDVAQTFEDRLEVRVVDLRTGEYVAADDVDPTGYDPRKAARDPGLSDPVDGEDDLATIKRRERYSLVYLQTEGGVLQKVILPVRGLGLWGTLYGFLALDGGGRTVAGLSYYEHKETPGLGGEVDNPGWKAQWPGKKAFDDDGQVALRVKKGRVDPTISAEKDHQVDGLAGATITSNGVTNMMRYWLGEEGFGPYLDRLGQGGAD